MRVVMSVVVFFAVMACGPDLSQRTGSSGSGSSSAPGSSPGSASGPTSGAFSCLQVANGKRVSCADYQWTGGVYSTASWAAACSSASGQAGSACSRSGAAGGCRLTTISDGLTFTTTTWIYTDAYPSGTDVAQAVRASCPTGTILSP